MREMTLNEAAKLSGARLSAEAKAVAATVRGVSIDSRTTAAGDLFVAIQGERFNGHDFVGQAVGRGAAAAMISKQTTEAGGAPLLFVDDTLAGLQSLAKNYRASLDLRTVAVAGSNGKTGTKELVAAVLGTRFSVLKNEGNLNNHVGVPLSLLRLKPAHEIGVFEVGTNHPGELIPLLEMVRPLAGIITVIGEEHLEYFRDLEGVAQEEGALAEILPSEGLLVLNADDPWSAAIARRCKARVVTFGFSRVAHYRAVAVEAGVNGVSFKMITPSGEHDVDLGLLGRHQAANALAAAAVGDFFGVELEQIVRGLESVTPARMRMQRKMTADGVLVINDAYNANPSSMRAALETVRDLSIVGRRFAVLGEMRELGAAAESAHRDAGRIAAESGMDVLVVVGEGARDIAEGARTAARPPARIEFCASPAEAGALVRGEARQGDVVLLKASRGVAIERALEGWE